MGAFMGVGGGITAGLSPVDIGGASGASAGASAGAAAGGESAGLLSTEGLATIGTGLLIAGVVSGAINSFYAASTARYQLKSQQLALEFQKTAANINARRLETEAQSVLLSGQRQIGQYTMRAGAQRGAAQASLAAQGVQAGVGSAAEIMASGDTIAQIDALTINANTVQAAEATRMQATQQRVNALMAGTQAAQLGYARGGINPGLMAGSSLLGGAGEVASTWAVMRSRGLYGSEMVG